MPLTYVYNTVVVPGGVYLLAVLMMLPLFFWFQSVFRTLSFKALKFCSSACFKRFLRVGFFWFLHLARTWYILTPAYLFISVVFTFLNFFCFVCFCGVALNVSF